MFPNPAKIDLGNFVRLVVTNAKDAGLNFVRPIFNFVLASRAVRERKI